jgi:voltage-gated potassium channel
VIAAIQRGDKLIIPNADVVLIAGDMITLGAEEEGNGMPVSIKEIILRKNHPWNGTKIRDIDISRQSYFVMIKRAGAVMSPWDDLVLKEGDKAFLLSKGRRDTYSGTH